MALGLLEKCYLTLIIILLILFAKKMLNEINYNNLINNFTSLKTFKHKLMIKIYLFLKKILLNLKVIIPKLIYSSTYQAGSLMYPWKSWWQLVTLPSTHQFGYCYSDHQIKTQLSTLTPLPGFMIMSHLHSCTRLSKCVYDSKSHVN